MSGVNSLGRSTRKIEYNRCSDRRAVTTRHIWPGASGVGPPALESNPDAIAVKSLMRSTRATTSCFLALSLSSLVDAVTRMRICFSMSPGGKMILCGVIFPSGPMA